MSLLFDALNRAQGSAHGSEAKSVQMPDASAHLESGSNVSPDGQKETATAQSLLSTGKKRPAILPFAIAGMVLLIAGAAWFYYQQSQLSSVAPAQSATPLTAEAAAPTASQVAAASSVAATDSASAKPLALADAPTASGNPTDTNATQKSVASPAKADKKRSARNGQRKTARPAAGIVAGRSQDPLQEGYQALSQGRLDQAERYYQLALAQHPHEKDALLGLAVIAQRKQQTQRATELYQQVLREDIGNTTAAAGLVSLSEHADPLAAESQLKQLIDIKSNAPEFHYALGNVLARQLRWGEAQQSFFRAHSLAPTNALYAYNLAVALEHLHQPAAALPYYVKASQLATPGDASLNRAVIQQRIQELQQTAIVTQ